MTSFYNVPGQIFWKDEPSFILEALYQIAEILVSRALIWIALSTY